MAAGKNEEEKIEKGGKIGEMASKMENASFLSYENFLKTALLCLVEWK